jgi:hypothetical protein
MRSLSLLVSVCLLLVSSTGAQAQDYLLTRSEPASWVQVRGPTRPFQFREYDAEAIKGRLHLVESLAHESGGPCAIRICN